MTLDRAVASAVVRASLLEAAVHSPQSWFIQIGRDRVRARRVVHPHGVTFVAEFDDVRPGERTATLYEGRQQRSAQQFDYPGPGYFCMKWDVTLKDSLLT